MACKKSGHGEAEAIVKCSDYFSCRLRLGFAPLLWRFFDESSNTNQRVRCR